MAAMRHRFCMVAPLVAVLAVMVAPPAAVPAAVDGPPAAVPAVMVAPPVAVPAAVDGPAAAGPSRQSPVRIGIGGAVPDRLAPLRFEYATSTTVRLRYVRQDAADPAGCRRRGDEETVRAEVPPGAGTLWVGDAPYALEQVHWHTPSEHVIQGRRYPVEQHLVHRGRDGRLLVVAVLVGDGLPHRELGTLLAAAPGECAPAVAMQAVDLTALLPASTASYRYPGSLTTAPYTEGVSWVVLARPLHAATADVAPFLRLFPDGNARPVQPLDGRSVRTDRPARR